MADVSQFCISGTEICRTMSEWGTYWQALSVTIAMIIGGVGLYKIHHELIRLKEQRQKDIDDKNTSSKLKRIEFFLNQHRRLFDNAELFEILCLIDCDHPDLADCKLADKKRKFLTFLEEIALLVRSEQIDSAVAYYMFGYYSICVLEGTNFAKNIDTSRQYWGLLYEFAGNARAFLDIHKAGPPLNMRL